MNELTEKLWPAFLGEATEQIEALELSLVGADVSAIDVNSVFRNMHTIKGGCAMMGFGAMQAVAHAAEDLLDLVRRGERVLDDALVDVMLAAVDALKQQLQEVTQTRTDPGPKAELVAQLRGMAAATAGASPAAAAAGRGKRKTPGTASPAPATSIPAAVAATPASTGGFAGRARQELPALVKAWLGGQPSPAPLLALAQAAQADGYPAIAAQLHAVPASEPGAPRRALLADLLDRIHHVESAQKVDCGVTATATELRVMLAGDLQLALQLLGGEIQAMRPGATADASLAAAEQATAFTGLLQLPHTSRLLRFITQVLLDATRERLVLDAELLELLQVAGNLPAELVADEGEDGPYVAMCEQVLERLRGAAHDAGTGDSTQRLLKQLRQQLTIRQETLDTLSPRAVESLRDAVARGRTLVEIEADLEATPDSGEEFVNWLSATGTIISNHTVFHREISGGGEIESTRLRFLAAFNGTLDDIKRGLGELDPDRRWYDLHACSPETTPVDNARIEGVTAAGPAVAAGAAAPQAASTLRIDSATLDQFVNRVGEMVMLRNMLSHALHDDELTLRLRRLRHVLGNPSTQAAAINSQDANALRDLLGDVDARLEHLAQADLRLQGALGRLQEDVLGLRVVPIGVVFNRLPRMVRDLSHAQQKQVELEISGEDVRIDKGMVDVLLEPLMHMVRNSIDHGVELPAERAAAGKRPTATLWLSARQQGNSLLIEVSDDGRGLNRQRIRAKARSAGLLTEADAASLSDRELCNLIFLPGFSTAEKVTEVSGRGVGMDVVKTRIMQLGGQIDVQSPPGEGARFTLRMPLSVAIQNVILVAVGDRQFALPERNVTEVVSIGASQLQHIQGQAACLLRGVTLPVYHLGALMGAQAQAQATGDSLEIIVVSDGVFRIGVLVDRVVGRPEVFVRDMHPDLARLPGVGGVSILGDGRVVIILDCENLFELATRNAQSLRSLLRAS